MMKTSLFALGLGAAVAAVATVAGTAACQPLAKGSAPAPTAPSPPASAGALGTATGVSDAPRPSPSGPALVPPARAESEASVASRIIIWGGGTTPNDAEGALAEWRAEKKVFDGVVSLGEGFPRVLASASVPGLKPGLHVVVLGACPSPEVDKVLAVLQGLRQGVYARSAALPGASASACPRREHGFAAAEVQRVTKNGKELTEVGLVGIGAKAAAVPWIVKLTLRDAGGALLDASKLDPSVGYLNGTCDGPETKKTRDGFVFEVACVGPSATGPEPVESKVALKYTIGDRKIDFYLERRP